MKPIYHFKAMAYFRTKKRCHSAEIFDTIAAANEKEATRAFVDAWSAPNVSLTEIKWTKEGSCYNVTGQPESFSFCGHKFRDGDIQEVSVFPGCKTIHFLTKERSAGLSIGLNWTEEEFKEIIGKLQKDLALE